MLTKLITFVAALFIALPVYAQGTPKTKSAIDAEINAVFPDNVTGAITPAAVRGAFHDFNASWQQYTGVNPQAGTSYTVQNIDYGRLVTFNNSGSIAVSLPDPSTAGFTPFNVYIANIGTGLITVTPTSGTVGGQTSINIAATQSVWFISDGTNYQVVYNAVATGTSGPLPIPITWLGAKCDGTTNDATAINAVAALGATIYIPAGATCYTTSAINITVSGTQLFGVNEETSCLSSGTANAPVVSVSAVNNIGIHDICIKHKAGVSPSSPGHGIVFNGETEETSVYNVDIGNNYIGFLGQTTNYSTIHNVYSHNNASHGFYFANSTTIGVSGNPVQWIVDGTLSNANNRQRLHHHRCGRNGVTQVTLGNWSNISSFGNHGIWSIGAGLRGARTGLPHDEFFPGRRRDRRSRKPGNQYR